MADTMPTRLFLTGYMGVGKSTIGHHLARRIHYRLIDTDRQLMRQFGKTITHIFKEDGEEAFRAAELALIQELATADKMIISAGGGTLARPDTLPIALASGLVLYLKAPVDVLYERVIFSPKDRPMINVPDAEAAFKARFAEREPFYEQAHWVVNTNVRQPTLVVDDIMARFEQHGWLAPGQTVLPIAKPPTD
jgi:shikimate kinase